MKTFRVSNCSHVIDGNKLFFLYFFPIPRRKKIHSVALFGILRASIMDSNIPKHYTLFSTSLLTKCYSIQCPVGRPPLPWRFLPSKVNFCNGAMCNTLICYYMLPCVISCHLGFIGVASLSIPNMPLIFESPAIRRGPTHNVLTVIICWVLNIYFFPTALNLLHNLMKKIFKNTPFSHFNKYFCLLFSTYPTRLWWTFNKYRNTSLVTSKEQGETNRDSINLMELTLWWRKQEKSRSK